MKYRSMSPKLQELNESINNEKTMQTTFKTRVNNDEYINMIPSMERRLMFLNEPLLFEYINQYQSLDAYELNQYLCNKQSKRNMYINKTYIRIGF